jgi:aromatic-L-amino-acid decarboxylase
MRLEPGDRDEDARMTPPGTASSPVPAAPAIEAARFRRLGHELVDVIAEYLASMRERPVFAPMQPAERATLLQEALAEQGRPPEAVLERFRTAVLPHAMGNGHPRFFGWVNSPPAPMGVLADFLAAAMNPSCAGGDHAAIYVERAAVRWLMELIEFPTSESMGLLVSGGSMANMIGLAAARQHAAALDGWSVRTEGLQRGRPPLVLYTSDQGRWRVRRDRGRVATAARAPGRPRARGLDRARSPQVAFHSGGVWGGTRT